MHISKHLRHTLLVALIIPFALFLTGCSGGIKNMREVPAEEAHFAPEAGKAMIVFMRPSTMGFAIQSSVFDTTEEKSELVGIVASKAKVAYQVAPGSHTFMVVGESADFMSAELDAGKTYYALVTPRMGVWKARFSLAPVGKAQLDGAEFKDWDNSCKWVEKSDESVSWAAENQENIEEKRASYMAKWMSKPASERPALLATDGK